MADWLKIKNEYINSTISQRKLAEKHGVSANTLIKRASVEKWKELREHQYNNITTKVQQKTAEVVATKEADRISRILSSADLLLARVEEAAAQLDTHIVTNKVKTKTVIYNKANKPTKEVVREEETKEMVAAGVDRLGLQQVASALKSIKETVAAIEGSGGDTEDDGFIDALQGKAADVWQDE